MLITPEYQALQTDLHHRYQSYGMASVYYAPRVDGLIRNYQFTELLDYGAGKGRLAQSLKQPVKVVEYDPAIPGKDVCPQRRFELVCCIDVLEHIEPDCLREVVAHLCDRIEQVGFITVHTGPAKKVLADGRNAHLIQQDALWWVRLLGEFASVEKVKMEPKGFWCLVT